MSYYPILKAPGCKGWTTLSNYSPNNWETRSNTEKYICVSWVEDGLWRSEYIGRLRTDEMERINSFDLNKIVPEDALPFLSLSTKKLPVRGDSLPQENNLQTSVPEWRATLGLSTDSSDVSYQGEINPFPQHGSLLTFCPFLQEGKNIENYMMFLNLENSPVTREATVEIYDAEQKILRGNFNVSNNNITIISLDNLGFTSTDLPVIICRGMSAIPLYFSKDAKGKFLSLEHTHPPASFVIHGKRFNSQKALKNKWFSILQNK